MRRRCPQTRNTVMLPVEGQARQGQGKGQAILTPRATATTTAAAAAVVTVVLVEEEAKPLTLLAKSTTIIDKSSEQERERVGERERGSERGRGKEGTVSESKSVDDGVDYGLFSNLFSYLLSTSWKWPQQIMWSHLNGSSRSQPIADLAKAA